MTKEQDNAGNESASALDTPAAAAPPSTQPATREQEVLRIDDQIRELQMRKRALSIKVIPAEALPTRDEKAALEFTRTVGNKISGQLAKFSVWAGAASAAGLILLAPNLNTFANWIGAPLVFTGVTFLGLSASIALVSRYFEVKAEAVEAAIEMVRQWREEGRTVDPVALGYAVAALQPALRQKRLLAYLLQVVRQPRGAARRRVTLTYWQIGLAIAQSTMLAGSVALLIYGLWTGMGVTWGRSAT